MAPAPAEPVLEESELGAFVSDGEPEALVATPFVESESLTPAAVEGAAAQAPGMELDELPAIEEGDDEPLRRLEGRNPLLEAMKAGRQVNRMWVLRGRKDPVLAKIVAMAKEQGAVIQELDRRDLDRMSSTHGHQGVVAAMAAKPYAELDGILALAAERNEPLFLLALDEIQDAHNLGAILRVADACGAHGVVLPRRRSAALDAVVAKVSAGAVEHVPVTRVANLAQTLDSLKKKGVWVYGTDASGDAEYGKVDFSVPMVLVVGGEGEGIREMIRKRCDGLVRIAMWGAVNSLNAAVATGVVAMEVARQRHAGQ